MLGELSLLLASLPSDATFAEYREAVLEQNVLRKHTRINRQWSLRALRSLFALSPEVTLFRVLRGLWETNDAARPVVAALSAVARDPLMRSTVPLLIRTPTGTRMDAPMFAAAVDEALPDRHTPTALARIGRNLASSWTQAGHLSGKVTKVRTSVTPTVESLVYALMLGYLSGARADALFETAWCALLDTPPHTLRELAEVAARRGWIDYRHAGGVTQIGFARLLPEEYAA